MKKSDPPVVVDNRYQASAKKVWRALTVVDQMTQWYFENIPAFKSEVGFETLFAVESGGRQFPHHWTVTEADAPKRIAYRWRYDNYPGDGYVVFELSEKGASTDLRLTMHVHEDFPDEIPEFRRESCIGGWEYFLGERLKEYLEQ